MITEPASPTADEIKKFKVTALKELSELNDSDEEIFHDEECAELTDEQLARLMPVYSRRNDYRLTAQ